MGENKAKKESTFKQVKRNIFISMTRRSSTKEYNEMIKKMKEETGEEPDIKYRRAMRKQIVEKNAKKMEGRAIISAATIVLASSIGFGTGYALNEGSGKTYGVIKTENGVNIDSSKIDGEIIIDIPNQEAVSFRDRYRVTEDNEIISEHGIIENEMIDLFELQNNVTQEVEALKTEDEILNYVKEEYVKEYNKTHEEKISVENVTFYRSEHNMVYVDTATNGEKINRVCSENYAKEHELKQLTGGTGQIINIRIDGKLEEIAVGTSDHFERGYSETEEVQEPSENSISEKIGNLINAGIEYAYPEEGNKLNYKMKLINAIVEYRESKIKEIINGKVSEEKEAKDKKTSNEFEIGE